MEPTDNQPQLEFLFNSLTRRTRPEEVAEVIERLIGSELNGQQLTCLRRASRRSVHGQLAQYSTMLADFARPIGLERQVRVAEAVFRDLSRLRTEQCNEPRALEGYLLRLHRCIGKAWSARELAFDRLNRGVQEALGFDMSRRQYNRRFRRIARMEQRLAILVRVLRTRRQIQYSRPGLARELSYAEFSADPASACFIAYFVARASLARAFTIVRPQRAFDQIAEMLLVHALKSARCQALAIAHVYTSKAVLARLDEQDKVRLVGRWFEFLRRAGDRLQECWRVNDIDRNTMILRRGNGFSTWNTRARAFNRARKQWLGLLEKLSMTDLLTKCCPGKVPALVAVDVTATHRTVRDELNANIRVWAELPFPWRVLNGELRSGRTQVEQACAVHDVNPRAQGWIQATAPVEIRGFRPTSERVDGSTASSLPWPKARRRWR